MSNIELIGFEIEVWICGKVDGLPLFVRQLDHPHAWKQALNSGDTAIGNRRLHNPELLQATHNIL